MPAYTPTVDRFRSALPAWADHLGGRLPAFLQTVVDGGRAGGQEEGSASWQYGAGWRTVPFDAATPLFAIVADTPAGPSKYDCDRAAGPAIAAERAAANSLTISRRRPPRARRHDVLVVLAAAELSYRQYACWPVCRRKPHRFTNTRRALFQALGGGWWNIVTTISPNPAQRLTCRPPKPAGVAPKTAATQNRQGNEDHGVLDDKLCRLGSGPSILVSG